MPAVRQHKRLLSPWLLLGGTVILATLVSLAPPVISAAVAGTIKACLVQVIDTSQWSPPNADPRGMTLLPNGHLLVCNDLNSGVYPDGINLYEATTSGTQLATASTLGFTKAPTGVTVNPSTGHLFFSDDDVNKVFEVEVRPDGTFGTVTSFDTSAFGCTDPEGLAFGLGDLFVVSGVTATAQEVYQLSPGPNGRFDGVPPAGDDVLVNHFAPGMADPEGVAFDPATTHLYVIDGYKHVTETTLSGTVVNTIDISGMDACLLSDGVVAPSSVNSGVKHLYISDRGANDVNDGTVSELALDPTECAQIPQNLLHNPGFELDCTNSTFPTKWDYGAGTSTTRNFTRSSEVVHSGLSAGKHFATDNSSYNVSQTIAGLSAGTTYTFSGWVNIPPATFTTASFGLEVKWINSSNTAISITPIKTYTTPTGGWDEVVASLVAPAGTVSAQVRMVVSNMNATIYVDDFMFTAAASTAPPTITSFTPTSGPVGTQVTISGSNFTGATRVAFNGTTASFTVNSNTQITATVPSGASSGPISVTTPAGTAVSASNFTVTAPPPPPTANFSGSPTSGMAPLTVQFTDQSTGNPTSWAWDFQNDGTVDSTLQNPRFTYTAAGSYTVKLTVSNAAGSNTTTKVGYITVTVPPPPPSNLLLNPGFELDANGDGKPDDWSTSSKFTRSSEVVHSGSYAGKFLVTDNSGSTVNQTVNDLTAGTTYSFSGWVNISPTIGLSTFTLRVRWLNASDGLISTQTIKSYTALTLGWDQATASMVAPAGTTHAQVEMTVETLLLNLNTTVYVDDFVFKQ